MGEVGWGVGGKRGEGAGMWVGGGPRRRAAAASPTVRRERRHGRHKENDDAATAKLHSTGRLVSAGAFRACHGGGQARWPDLDQNVNPMRTT